MGEGDNSMISRQTIRISVISMALAFSLSLSSFRVNAETGYVGDEQVTIENLDKGRFIYPRAALRRSIEGKVVLELTVGVTGDVVDAFVVEASPPNRFEKNALKYVRGWKYAPHVVNGVHTQVEKVAVTVTYRLR
jgi:protein TonB